MNTEEQLKRLGWKVEKIRGYIIVLLLAVIGGGAFLTYKMQSYHSKILTLLNELKKEESKSAPKEDSTAKTPARLKSASKARYKGKCASAITALTVATRMYQTDYGVYPPSGNANLVRSLQTKGPKKMPYYKFPTDLLNGRGEVIDPWGNPYVYQNNQSDWSEGKLSETARRTLSFNIHSFGPDGVDNKGSGDDLGN